MSDETHFEYHRDCPECGSSDALAVYSDGGGHCFSHGCNAHWGPGSFGDNPGDPPLSEAQQTSADLEETVDADFVEVEFRDLPKRGLSREVCERYGYGIGRVKGHPAAVAPFYSAKSGKLIGQKVRGPNKKFFAIGTVKDVFFGQQIARQGGRMLVVTEGCEDAMSVSQVMSLRFPAVSVPNGASSARKTFAANMAWLLQFETVVICFDEDDAGREAAEEAAKLLPIGRVKIAKLPLKDANDMLKAGRGDELRDAIWNAKEWRPDGIVSIADFIDEACRPSVMGIPWWTEELTELTYGRRYGEVYGFGAGTGAGKTDWFTQQMEYDITTLEEPVGAIYLEMPRRELAQRLAGKVAGKRFHIPNAGWAEEELRETLERIKDKVYLYDHFGNTKWEDVAANIRYMNGYYGIRHFYLDHLTALADPSNERESLEELMGEMAMLAKEKELMIHYISHLSTPNGTPHEEGGRVSGSQFKGARAIQFWSDFLFGIERNQQADSPEERRTSFLRVIKDRYSGAATGSLLPMIYNLQTGVLEEADASVFSREEGDF